MNQLTIIEKMNPIEIFSSGQLDSILDKIKEEATAQPQDTSTEKGRKEIASMAYKVSRSKTLIDDLGKKLGEEAQKTLNKINAERKKARENLDKLKDEIRLPLTNWELKEKARIDNHNNSIMLMQSIAFSNENKTLSSSDIQVKIDQLNNIIGNNFEEMSDQASRVFDSSMKILVFTKEAAEIREKERAELEALRARELERYKEEQALIELKEKEHRLKREAEEKIFREKAEKENADRVEKETLAKIEKAKQQAIAAEQARILKIKTDEAAEQAKRESNKKHIAKINNEVLGCLIQMGFDEPTGKNIVTAIVNGRIKHTKITY